MNSRNAFLLLPALTLLVAAFPHPASAQDVSTRFRIVTWKSGQPSGFSYFHKEKLIDVDDLQTGVRSISYDYSGPAKMPIYPPTAEIPSPTNPGDKPEPIAVVSLLSGIKQPLILLVPAPEGTKPPFNAVVIEDHPSAIPFPSYYFVNFSPRNVAISLGKEQFEIAPGKRKLATSDLKTLNLRMAVKLEGTESWKIIYDDYYPNWPEERTIIFIMDVSEDERPRLEPRVILENKAVWGRSIRSNKEESP